MKTKLLLNFTVLLAAGTVVQGSINQSGNLELKDQETAGSILSSSAATIGGLSAFFLGSAAAGAYKYNQHTLKINEEILKINEKKAAIEYAEALSALENEGGSTGVIKPAKFTTPISVQTARFTSLKSAITSPAAKLVGLYTGFTTLGVAVYKYNQHLEAQAEATRLANRSYTEKFMDGVSHYAQAAKANTWDKELFGYKQGGKVATVAGVAAVAGLSYLAYKKNPFGKAVVKTVAPKVVTPVAKRKLSVI